MQNSFVSINILGETRYPWCYGVPQQQRAKDLLHIFVVRPERHEYKHENYAQVCTGIHFSSLVMGPVSPKPQTSSSIIAVPLTLSVEAAKKTFTESFSRTERWAEGWALPPVGGYLPHTSTYDPALQIWRKHEVIQTVDCTSPCDLTLEVFAERKVNSLLSDVFLPHPGYQVWMNTVCTPQPSHLEVISN